MSEQWRDIPGWEGVYQASSSGNVRSVDRLVSIPSAGGSRERFYKGKVLKPRIWESRSGVRYRIVHLSFRGTSKHMKVARAVALSFMVQTGPQVRHLDGDSLTDDLYNLAWGSQSDNEADKKRHGTTNEGIRHWNASLAEAEVHEIRREHAGGVTPFLLAKRFGMTYRAVKQVIDGDTWKHLL